MQPGGVLTGEDEDHGGLKNVGLDVSVIHLLRQFSPLIRDRLCHLSRPLEGLWDDGR